ncbi:MAG: OmpA family protein [Deltaproteobacteria bacterium]|nr:OmpA family protein [Deltaproteobacteria bacterium]
MARKKHEEHENHERWLVSYADFITLLFAFFTVLYATASTDKAKLDAVVDGLTAAFQGGMPMAMFDSEVHERDAGSSLDEYDLNLSAQADPVLRTLKMHLDGSLSDNVVQIGLHNQTLTVELPERLLFAPGSAELHPSAFDTLTRVADALKSEEIVIDVSGHADGVPVTGGPYTDNWGLASARAVATTRFLESRGVPLGHLVASATLTRATNPEARAVTLRVVARGRVPTAAVLDTLYADEAVGAP